MCESKKCNSFLNHGGISRGSYKSSECIREEREVDCLQAGFEESSEGSTIWFKLPHIIRGLV